MKLEFGKRSEAEWQARSDAAFERYVQGAREMLHIARSGLLPYVTERAAVRKFGSAAVAEAKRRMGDL